MADGSSNWIDLGISLVGVAETALWVALVGALAVRYRKPLESVVSSISARVQRGDNIDLFGIKLEAVQESAKAEADLERIIRETVGNIGSNFSPQIVDSDRISDEIINQIRERHFLTIDFSFVLTDEKTTRSVPYDQFGSIGLLLRFIWTESRAFEQNSYGRKWIVRNERTGEHLINVGSTFARRHFGTYWDERPLADVGILVGDTLSVHHLR